MLASKAVREVVWHIPGTTVRDLTAAIVQFIVAHDKAVQDAAAVAIAGNDSEIPAEVAAASHFATSADGLMGCAAAMDVLAIMCSGGAPGVGEADSSDPLLAASAMVPAHASSRGLTDGSDFVPAKTDLTGHGHDDAASRPHAFRASDLDIAAVGAFRHRL